jgi:hypothetical protein
MNTPIRELTALAVLILGTLWSPDGRAEIEPNPRQELGLCVATPQGCNSAAVAFHPEGSVASDDSDQKAELVPELTAKTIQALAGLGIEAAEGELRVNWYNDDTHLVASASSMACEWKPDCSVTGWLTIVFTVDSNWLQQLVLRFARDSSGDLTAWLAWPSASVLATIVGNASIASPSTVEALAQQCTPKATFEPTEIPSSELRYCHIEPQHASTYPNPSLPPGTMIEADSLKLCVVGTAYPDEPCSAEEWAQAPVEEYGEPVACERQIWWKVDPIANTVTCRARGSFLWTAGDEGGPSSGTFETEWVPFEPQPTGSTGGAGASSETPSKDSTSDKGCSSAASQTVLLPLLAAAWASLRGSRRRRTTTVR